MLCHDQLVLDFGPMQGTRSQSVPDFGPMQSVPDFGPMQLVPDFGPMQWARPSMCFICYCVVCGSFGELTKLRAYSFSFGFRYFRKQRVELGMMASHTPQLQFLSWELIQFL